MITKLSLNFLSSVISLVYNKSIVLNENKELIDWFE